jgi:DNA-binding NtrC family response regulator
MSRRLICTSHIMREIYQEAQDIARTDVKVLITGENGVGKDVVARLIHERGNRRGPLVRVNCAVVPERLLEWQLFGQAQSTFSGGQTDTPGRLEQAQGGTIVLDEVVDLSVRLQTLVLQFLERGEIRRVGADRAQVLRDVRVIATTSRNLFQAVEAQRFREDLYYRLNIIHIVVPPLRERREDIAPLFAHFLDRFSELHDLPRPRLTSQARAKLKDYAWPGNVRELSNVVEQMIVSNRTGLISAADLPPVVSGVLQPRRPVADVLYARWPPAVSRFTRSVSLSHRG